MKVLKVIGIVIAVLVVIVVVLGLIAPNEYSFKRSTVINAPADVIYNNVRLYSNFDKWEPWSKYDEGKNKVTFEGTDGTVGAKRSWKGDKTGSGSMTIVDLQENKSVVWNLFFGPFKDPNKVTVTITPAEGGQQVEWGINGRSPFPFNGLGLFYSMEKAMGKDFEDGLTGLKTLSESGGSTVASKYKIEEIDWAEKKYVSHRETVKIAELAPFLGKHYPAIAKELGSQGAKPGIPVAVYYTFNTEKGNTDVAAAIPYNGKDVKVKGYDNLTLPATKGYKIDYYGAYGEAMEPAYLAMKEFLLAKHNTKDADYVIEEYVGDPMVEKDPSKLHTVIYFFVKDKTAAK